MGEAKRRRDRIGEHCIVADYSLRCYRPVDHAGACGQPLTDEEVEDGILWGTCSARRDMLAQARDGWAGRPVIDQAGLIE